MINIFTNIYRYFLCPFREKIPNEIFFLSTFSLEDL